MTETAYHAWLARKTSAMKHPLLSCGCPNVGQPTYIRGCCDLIVCGRHQREQHEHPEPAEPEPVPARVDLRPPSPYEPPQTWTPQSAMPQTANGRWVQLDDTEYPDWAWRADVTERIHRASAAELVEALRTGKLKVKRPAEVGEAATQSPIKDPGPTRAEIEQAARSIDAARSLGLHFWRLDASVPEGVCEVCGHPYLGGPVPARCTPPKRSLLSRIWRYIHG